MSENIPIMLLVGVILIVSVTTLKGVKEILSRQEYITCSDVGLGERKATTVHPDKNTIIIQCDGVSK